MNVMYLDVRGRQSGSVHGESLEHRPKPLPRQKRLLDDDDDDNARAPVATVRTSQNSLDRKTPPARKTPTGDQRLTPVDWRKSPANDRDPFAARRNVVDDDRGYRYGESHQSPLDRRDFTDRKSPLSDIFRKSPLDRREFEEGKESFVKHGMNRKSPSERRDYADRKSPLDHEPPSMSSRKSPFDDDKHTKSNRQKSPATDRKTPTTDHRKTPVSFQRKKEDSPSVQRKGSVVDLLTESAGVRESVGSDEERKYRSGRRSGSPQSRGRKSTSPSSKRDRSTEKNPFENVRKSPGASSKASKQQRSVDGEDTRPARPSSRVSRLMMFCILIE